MGRVQGRHLDVSEAETGFGADLDPVGDGPAPTAARVLGYLVSELVDDPAAVMVEAVPRRRGGVLLEVHVGAGDMGRVIGRRGRTAASIRTVVRAAATRDGVEVDVDFAD